MFTEAYAYDLKKRSVVKETLTVSLVIHLLLATVLQFFPFQENTAPEAARPEKQIIKLTSVPPPKQQLPPQTGSLPPVAQNTASHPQLPTPVQPIAKPAPAKPETMPPAKAVTSPTPVAVPSLPEATVLPGAEAAIAGAQPGKAASGEAARQAASGAPAAQGGTGAGAPVISFDNIRAKFISALEKNKEYPYIARRQNQTGLVGLAVSLDAAGNLQNVRITKSSGFSQIDNAALALARKVCPFAHNAGQSITMNVSINYDLKG